DPRTNWATSVRALASLLDAGLVRRIGLSNVNRRQLDEALELASISAVEVSLSLLDDEPLRGGVVARCAERGLAAIARSPLSPPPADGGLPGPLPPPPPHPLSGGRPPPAPPPHDPARAARRDPPPSIAATPGARRPEPARSAGGGARLHLDELARARLRP